MEAVRISSRKKYIENYSIHGPKVTALVQLLGNAPDLSAHVVLVGNVLFFWIIIITVLRYLLRYLLTYLV